MSRMYFCFKTNLKDSEDGVMTEAVDYIAFETVDGKIISVSCNDTSDFGITNSQYDARFKGLEVKLEDADNLDHDYEEMTYNDFKLLSMAQPYEIGLYIADDRRGITSPVTCKSFSAKIEFYDSDKDKIFEKRFYKNQLEVMI